jgi:tRNA 2-thiouridine synthesizing protein E
MKKMSFVNRRLAPKVNCDERASRCTMDTRVSPDYQRPVRPLQAIFDTNGYLADPAQWSPTLAEQLAAEAGIDYLGPAHWRVIDHVRERFFAFGSLPVMRLVCRAAGIKLGTAHRLFSGCASLWRIAGLPDPGEEARAYMH